MTKTNSDSGLPNLTLGLFGGPNLAPPEWPLIWMAPNAFLLHTPSYSFRNVSKFPVDNHRWKQNNSLSWVYRCLKNYNVQYTELKYINISWQTPTLMTSTLNHNSEQERIPTEGFPVANSALLYDALWSCTTLFLAQCYISLSLNPITLLITKPHWLRIVISKQSIILFLVCKIENPLPRQFQSGTQFNFSLGNGHGKLGSGTKQGFL